MTFEQNPEKSIPKRSLFSPPAGPVDGVKTILWNERELRAGWRLVLYVVLLVGFCL